MALLLPNPGWSSGDLPWVPTASILVCIYIPTLTTIYQIQHLRSCFAPKVTVPPHAMWAGESVITLLNTSSVCVVVRLFLASGFRVDPCYSRIPLYLDVIFALCSQDCSRELDLEALQELSVSKRWRIPCLLTASNHLDHSSTHTSTLPIMHRFAFHFGKHLVKRWFVNIYVLWSRSFIQDLLFRLRICFSIYQCYPVFKADFCITFYWVKSPQLWDKEARFCRFNLL